MSELKPKAANGPDLISSYYKTVQNVAEQLAQKLNCPSSLPKLVNAGLLAVVERQKAGIFDTDLILAEVREAMMAVLEPSLPPKD